MEALSERDLLKEANDKQVVSFLEMFLEAKQCLGDDMACIEYLCGVLLDDQYDEYERACVARIIVSLAEHIKEYPDDYKYPDSQ